MLPKTFSPKFVIRPTYISQKHLAVIACARSLKPFAFLFVIHRRDRYAQRLSNGWALSFPYFVCVCVCARARCGTVNDSSGFGDVLRIRNRFNFLVARHMVSLFPYRPHSHSQSPTAYQSRAEQSHASTGLSRLRQDKPQAFFTSIPPLRPVSPPHISLFAPHIAAAQNNWAFTTSKEG